MDYVRTIKAILDIIKIPIDLVREHRTLGHKLENGLQNLMYELDMMKEDLKSYQEVELLELVYDIEDFLLGLWIPEASGPVLSAFALDPREGYLEDIESFRKRIEKLEKRKERSTESIGADASRGDDPASSSVARELSFVGIPKAKEVILGLINPVSTSSQASGQEAGKRPKVISIVGCPGVGKTALARAVYDHYRQSNDFNCVAWVEASECNNKEVLLGKITEKVKEDLIRRAPNSLAPSEGDPNSSAKLHGILAGKRYLVFIDNMQQAEICDDIQPVFPENVNSSMLIVTTSVHSVANVCSSGSYVYTMQCLPPKESEKLFWESVGFFGVNPGTALRSGSQIILGKCDGLPLALISVAKYLRITKGKKLVKADCITVGKELGTNLVGGEVEKEFTELRRALGQCFDGLAQSDYKSCMLSLSIFPRNHTISSKSLVRRLIAEGLVANCNPKTSDELINSINHGRKCLEELVNRCIVEPVKICSWLKDCRVSGGIILEFIIHKSQSTNLVTLIRGEEVVYNPNGKVTVIQEEEVVSNPNGKIRRLSVQSSTKDKFHEVERNVGLSGIRSLTIFSSDVFIPSSSTSIPSNSELFKKHDCKFLRLLDLEGCRGFDEDPKLFRGICQLVYLKYLSLRKTNVRTIPGEIEKLQCLQTLDIRDTRKMELPIQVIMLPKLAFLFGQFVLPDMSDETKEFLLTKSKLHTIAGFVVNKVQGSEKIILEARNLLKVKVWCTCVSREPQTSITQKQKLVPPAVSKLLSKWLGCFTPPESSAALLRSSNMSSVPSDHQDDFVLSLQNHVTSLESLSIQCRCSRLSQGILASLEKGPCKLSSMKLWGKLGELPGIATLSQLNTLSKLQLFYTEKTSVDLSILQHLSCLEYLKLQDNGKGFWNGSFDVRKDGFESLRQLCFKASKLPKLQFEMGSLKRLTSLQLLCPDISQMQEAKKIGDNISHITSLHEVILHPSATNVAVEAWKTAAKYNANRPSVKQQKKPISAEL